MTGESAGRSRLAAGLFLLLAVACGVIGFLLNASITKQEAAAGTGSAALRGFLMLVAYGTGLALFGLAVRRFNQARRHGSKSARPLRGQTDTRVDEARVLAAGLLTGSVPVLDRVWDVVLRPGERVLLDEQLGFARFYGSGPAGVAGSELRWREQQPARVVVTDLRVLCQVRGKGWLSFEHKQIRAIGEVHGTGGVSLEYPGTPPLGLTGPASLSVLVVVVWTLHGPDGLREHPALAVLGPLPPAPPAPERFGGAAGDSLGPSGDTQRSAAETRTGDDEVEQRLLTFVAGNQLTLAVQAAALLETSPDEATRRLDALHDRGLVSRFKLSANLPQVYVITRAGASQVDGVLPGGFDLRDYRCASGSRSVAVGTARSGETGEVLAVPSDARG